MWHPDIPDLPLSKPKIIEKLEQMDPKALDSMPQVEIDEMVAASAHAIAKTYKDEIDNGYEECMTFVTIALQGTGSALGGKMGRAMIAASQQSAKNASLDFYPH